jgi:alpha-glucosidase (family GH31 glycosyl hydrolase)
MALMRKYFSLRTQLIPYIYTYTWQAHTLSLPLLRPLYLQYPQSEEAYHHSHEYFFGDEMLVAPVLDASGNCTVYLPEGEWIDFFTGKHYDGGKTFTAHYDVDQMPVFVRAGSIIPEQEPSDYSDAKPLDTLIVNVYGSGQGHFDLYEDDGVSLDYAKGRYAITPMSYGSKADGSHVLTVAAVQGTYKDQPTQRAYEVRIHALNKPQSVSVDGKATTTWRWDDMDATAIVTVPRQDIHNAVSVSWR